MKLKATSSKDSTRGISLPWLARLQGRGDLDRSLPLSWWTRASEVTKVEDQQNACEALGSTASNIWAWSRGSVHSDHCFSNSTY